MENAENADFECILCDFKCCKKSNYDIHCKTKKHVHRHNGNEMENAGNKKHAKHICQCGKKYESYSGLWKHEKTCKNEKKDLKEEEIATMKEIMKYLMKENSEMKNMMIEQQNMVLEVVKNGTHNTTTNTNELQIELMSDNDSFTELVKFKLFQQVKIKIYKFNSSTQPFKIDLLEPVVMLI